VNLRTMRPSNLSGSVGTVAIQHNNFVGKLHGRKAIPKARRLVFCDDDDRKP
jgi:hypothetical protein